MGLSSETYKSLLEKQVHDIILFNLKLLEFWVFTSLSIILHLFLPIPTRILPAPSLVQLVEKAVKYSICSLFIFS